MRLVDLISSMALFFPFRAFCLGLCVTYACPLMLSHPFSASPYVMSHGTAVPARSRARSSSAPRVRTRSASPAGRFDPTAYIRAREEKLRVCTCLCSIVLLCCSVSLQFRVLTRFQLAKERRSGSARRSRRASPSPLRSRASSREPSASPSRARTTSTSTPTRRQAPVQCV